MDEVSVPISTQHLGSVFCLASLGRGSGLLVTGSEDGSISLVDTQNKTTISRLVLSPDDIVNAVCPLNTRENQLFVAVGNYIHLCDSRKLSRNLKTFCYNDDEINHLVLAEDEKYMAVCDDSGAVAIVYVPTNEKIASLPAHSNICSALAFRQTHRTELFSAGYDCKLKLWNVAEKSELLSIDMQEEEGVEENRTHGILVNPPFIHSLALSKNKELLACGLQNGVTQVYYAGIKPLQYLATLPGHDKGVSQVHFPTFSENFLITGGNDNIVNAWVFDRRGPVNGLENGHVNDDEADSGEESTEDEIYEIDPHNYYPNLKNHIELNEKINWICSGQTVSKNYVAIADNSSTIKLFYV